MRDDICTIPISEVFEPKENCPICRLYDMLDEQIMDYTLGAAMMEPDIRIAMNELGFCNNHLKKLLGRKKRLPLGLIMESHLQTVNENVFKKGLLGFNAKKSEYSASKIESTCYICEKIDKNMQMMLTTIYKTYNIELDFRELFRKQDFLCLPHYRLLVSGAKSTIAKKPLKDFENDCMTLTNTYLTALREDVHKFTKMFDYRNSSDENANFDEVKNSLERAFEFLNGERIDN